MKKTTIFVVAAFAFFILFGGINQSYAQGTVINGDFQTETFNPFWTAIGGETANEIVLFATVPGLPNPCLRRIIGPPANNGAIEQKVYLMQGVSYIFSADIVAKYCDS